jgi:hypothetical protein
MLTARLAAVLALAAALSACASQPQVAWQPRAGANLAADKAECERTADDTGINSAKQFTDGRYGAVAALAAKVDDDSLRGGTVQRMRQAIFEDCMVRKGWTQK